MTHQPAQRPADMALDFLSGRATFTISHVKWINEEPKAHRVRPRAWRAPGGAAVASSRRNSCRFGTSPCLPRVIVGPFPGNSRVWAHYPGRTLIRDKPREIRNGAGRVSLGVERT